MHKFQDHLPGIPNDPVPIASTHQGVLEKMLAGIRERAVAAAAFWALLAMY